MPEGDTAARTAQRREPAAAGVSTPTARPTARPGSQETAVTTPLRDTRTDVLTVPGAELVQDAFEGELAGELAG